jgi:arginine decarboxylase-like protein
MYKLDNNLKFKNMNIVNIYGINEWYNEWYDIMNMVNICITSDVFTNLKFHIIFKNFVAYIINLYIIITALEIIINQINVIKIFTIKYKMFRIFEKF